ncbi:MAG: PEP-CTERM sorting domain-containing protein [Acidobacteriia bacterium]|nr:PEP-CTERM sorting domain-containing protein [Terriglobia bacterium]
MNRWMIGTLLASVMIVALPAIADTLSDSLTVFDPAGNVAYSISVTEALEDPNEIYFINVSGLIDPNQYANATTLVEPDGSYSDIFGVGSINGTLYLSFNSDIEGFPAAYGSQGAIFLPEGQGGVFDATMYLDPGLQAQGFTAQFFSDGDVVVPEPGTLTLLATGLLGTLGSIRKRFRL